MSLRTLISAAAIVGLMAGTASAAGVPVFIDFTDDAVWDGGGAAPGSLPATTSVNYGPLTVSVSTNPANEANFDQAFDGKNGALAYCGTILACKSDGLGVVGDEIQAQNLNVTPPRQSATLTFSKPVRITAVYFLDLFTNRPTGTTTTFEQANVYVDGAGTGAATTFQAALPFQLNGGFLGVENLAITVANTATFFASAAPSNDGVGQPDFSLAGLSVQVIPLPASALLFGSALAGLGLLGRRKQKTA